MVLLPCHEVWWYPECQIGERCWLTDHPTGTASWILWLLVYLQITVKVKLYTECWLHLAPCSVWQHLCIWLMSDNVWEPSERRQTAYRWIHSFQGLLYLTQMFDCHWACLCNLAGYLKGSSRNDNNTNIHNIYQWLMSYSVSHYPLLCLSTIFKANFIWKNSKHLHLLLGQDCNHWTKKVTLMPVVLVSRAKVSKANMILFSILCI